MPARRQSLADDLQEPQTPRTSSAWIRYGRASQM